MGEIKGQWLEEKQKAEILEIVLQAKEKGFSISRTCLFWKISRRRVNRWQTKKKRAISESPNSKIAYYIKLVLNMREIYLVQIHCGFCGSFSAAINCVSNPQKNQAVLRRDSYWPILARLDFLLESFN